ncbi:WD domain, G-beta repeat [Carpediemonas membranifera]|uniref:WD domain, G-beta repeat n=1 Tax=Carpediemonas membranifera TaxID=201153 RepID=A0A8J6E3Z5_9EUKA|nr:WD domain, G-beta repeat [Carpediemonas membranifera]|eukprot:KAG9396578.1 WD domain, G-beta repeat [Carpediemonas membranifera]
MASAEPVWAYGLYPGVNHCIGWIDDDTVVYLCGHNIIKLNLATHTHSFIPVAENVRAVLAFAISQNRRFIGLAERVHDSMACQISVYSLAQMQRVSSSAVKDTSSREIVRLTFAQDPKHLSIQYGGPDYVTVLYHWERAHVVATVNIQQEILDTTANPYDMAQMVSVGPQFLKMWRLSEYQYRGFNPINIKRITDTYVATLWMSPDSLLVSTEQGDLLLIDRGSLDGFMPAAALFGTQLIPRLVADDFGSPMIVDERPMECSYAKFLVPHGSGFIAASADGRVAVFHLITNPLDLETHSRRLLALEPDPVDHKYMAAMGKRRSAATPVMPGGLVIPSSTERRKSIISNGNMRESSELQEELKYMPFAKTFEFYIDAGVTITGMSLSPGDETLAIATTHGLYQFDFADLNDMTTELEKWRKAHAEVGRVTTVGQTTIDLHGGLDAVSEDATVASTSTPSEDETESEGTGDPAEIVDSLRRTRNSALIVAGAAGTTWFNPVKPVFVQPEQGYTCIDAAVTLPYMLLVSRGVIRVVNYITLEEVSVAILPLDITGAAIHPSGLHVVICCTDGSRVMHVCPEGLVECAMWEPRNCRAVSFDSTGGLVALAGTGHIFVYEFLTSKRVSTLAGHTGVVSTVEFNNDGTLRSASLDGAAFLWDISTGIRAVDSVLRMVQFTGIVGPVDDVIVASAADGMLREIAGNVVSHEIASGAHTITKLALLPGPPSRLVASAGRGAVCMYSLPLRSSVHTEVHLHSLAITGMKLINGTHLLTASEDGTVYLTALRPDITKPAPPPLTAVWDVALVPAESMFRQRRLMKELVASLDDTQEQGEFRVRALKQTLADTKSRLEAELESTQLKAVDDIHQLRAEMAETEDRLGRAVDLSRDSLAKSIAEIEMSADQRVKEAVDKYDRVRIQLADEKCKFDEKLAQINEKHQLLVAKMIREHEAEIARHKHAYEHLDEDCQLITKDYEIQIDQQVEEYEKEIRDLNETGASALETEKKRNAHLKGQALLLRKRFQTLSKEIGKRDLTIGDLKKELASFQLSDNETRQAMQRLQDELRERDAMIGEKERRIFELKRQNKELDKFKYVLDYKIREMRQELEPRDMLISDMRDQIAAMDTELEDDHREKQRMERHMKDLTMRAKSSQAELVHVREKLQSTETRHLNMAIAVHNIVHDLAVKEWPEAVRMLYRTYCANEEAVAGTPNVESLATARETLHDEMTRQREHLERSISSMKRSMVSQSNISSREQSMRLQENVELIGEINELRQENRLLANRVTQLQSIVLEYKRTKSTGTPSLLSSALGRSSTDVKPRSASSTKGSRAQAKGQLRGAVLPVPTPVQARVKSVTPISENASRPPLDSSSPGMVMTSANVRGVDLLRSKAQSSLGFTRKTDLGATTPTLR